MQSDVIVNHTDWLSIEISYNNYTLVWIIEACDNEAGIMKKISVEFENEDVVPNSYIVLRGDELQASFKDLVFYSMFHDITWLDECISICEEGTGECPTSITMYCTLDGGNTNENIESYPYDKNCVDLNKF